MDERSRHSAYSLQHLDLDGSRTSQSPGSRSPEKTDRTSACPKLLETERRQGPAEHLVKAYCSLSWADPYAAQPGQQATELNAIVYQEKKLDQHMLLNPTLSFAWKCFQIFPLFVWYCKGTVFFCYTDKVYLKKTNDLTF